MNQRMYEKIIQTKRIFGMIFEQQSVVRSVRPKTAREIHLIII